MAHPHPVVDYHPLPGPEPFRPSNFPTVALSDCPTQPPLDLNFSQKLPQNPLIKTQIESDSDPTLLQKESEASPSSQQDIVAKLVPDCATPNGIFDCAAPSKTPSDGAPSKSQKSRCHWTHGEVIALFDAKKAQAERFEKAGRKMRSASEKWDEIAEYCKSMGVKKQASQCKDKWERLWPSFRKILDWERSGKGNYWTMIGDEREREGFPRVFDKEVYDAMSARFGFIKSLNLSSIVVDSSNEDSVEAAVEAATNACNEPAQNGATVFEEVPSVVDDHAPISSGRKRKATARSSSAKQSPSDSGKPIVLCLEANQGAGGAKCIKDLHSKNKSADPAERKLILEERKLRLAERRLLLEERKLEATIEIGRGLIASMERMTNTISSLGVSSSPIE